MARLESDDDDLEFTKIEQVRPGMQHFNVVAKVMSVFSQRYSNNTTFLKCVLGDETAIIKASFPFTEGITKGVVLEFCNLRTFKQHDKLILNAIGEGSIYATDTKMPVVNEKLNISERKW